MIITANNTALAIHRAEADSFAELSEHFKIGLATECCFASRKVNTRDSFEMCRRLWSFGLHRYKNFSEIEYRIRTGLDMMMQADAYFLKLNQKCSRDIHRLTNTD